MKRIIILLLFLVGCGKASEPIVIHNDNPPIVQNPTNERVITCYYRSSSRIRYQSVAVGAIQYNSYTNVYTFLDKRVNLVTSQRGPCVF